MKIIYEQPNGDVSVIIPSPNWKGTIEELAEKDVPEGCWYVIVEDNVIPSDRTFRNAWKADWNKSAVMVDMPKAREVWKGKIRRARVPKLEALDVEYQRADEQKNQREKDEVAAQKQILRDMPQDPRIEIAQTPDQLTAIWWQDLD